MACVINQKDVKSWFAELSVDLEKVASVCCLGVSGLPSVYDASYSA